MARRRLALLPAALLLAACAQTPEPAAPETTTEATSPEAATTPATTPTPVPANPDATAADGRPFEVREVTSLTEPWAMEFLPDGRALVTLKGGTLLVLDPQSGDTTEVANAPEVSASGQGGMHDIALGPTFDDDGTIYLSWVESTGGRESRGVVGKGRLALDGEPALENLEIIWGQEPTSGNGHYALRLAVSPDGQHLFVSSGDRQKLDPAQDIQSRLGKIMRLTLQGYHVGDNPFVDEHGVAAEVWSYGHRNPLGLDVDPQGNLWSSEMGPRGGDELNLIKPGVNYGWPEVSEGDHYDGRSIPDHAGSSFEPPVESWVPAISPGNLMIYDGETFPQWQGDAFLGGLSGQTLVRVDLDGAQGSEAERWDMGERIREVEQSPDGTIYLLEDGRGGRVLQLVPPQ
ncbi:MAG: PQQ-dependent sugar dehydrogenase [Mobilicoccus sp.]|nr:PQQ-dependent sugar dehydrogenase [Mobilicoccus sp.]